MKMIFKVFGRKLFGMRYEKLKKPLFVWLLLFWSLHIAAFRLRIAPSILYLMVSAFSAGVMWQALSSEDNAANMQNLFMLPLKSRDFVFSYTAALGCYTLFTKTAGLLAVVLAVSGWQTVQAAGSILCGVNAVLMSTCAYAWKKYRSISVLWTGIITASIFFLSDTLVFFPIIIGSIMLTLLVLSNTDAYSFYLHDGRKQRMLYCPKHSHADNGCRTKRNPFMSRHIYRHSLWHYLLRYYLSHKNYLVNTVAMWLAACMLPAFFGETDSLSVTPVGFAILSLNTPICILLSANPALERAVRFLPSQKRLFCIPYCLFIFLCNMSANIIFLASFQIQIGGVNAGMIIMAVCFALQSAVFSVLLEWFFPIRNWKIESDLWHHPRKYIVPVTMLLLAGIVCTIPVLIYGLAVLLFIEFAYLAGI